MAAGVARRARVALTRLTPSRVNMPSSWEGYDLLTTITLRRADLKTLRINDATVNISREKRLIRTPLTGLGGTIKEYIGSGDYDIAITVGVVAVRDGGIVDEYPEAGISEVREFLEENQSLSVSSTFFALFGISDIVITRFSLRQETHSNRQVIEIQAVSDVNYVIKDTEY